MKNSSLLVVMAVMALLAMPMAHAQVTGQPITVGLSSNPITTGGSTTVSATIPGSDTFDGASPYTYAWTASGSCPDLVTPANTASSFVYTAGATSSSLTSTCVFAVTVNDITGNTGKGTSTALTVGPNTGQPITVSLPLNLIATGGSTKVSAIIPASDKFDGAVPYTYTWTTSGLCPDISNAIKSANTLVYTAGATSSSITSTCVFAVTVNDITGDTGKGTSTALIVVPAPTTTISSTTVSTTTTVPSTTTTSITTTVAPVNTTTTALALPVASPSSSNNYLTAAIIVVIVVVAALVYYYSVSKNKKKDEK